MRLSSICLITYCLVVVNLSGSVPSGRDKLADWTYVLFFSCFQKIVRTDISYVFRACARLRMSQ